MNIDTSKIKSCLSSLIIVAIIGFSGIIGYQIGAGSIAPSAKVTGIINTTPQNPENVDFEIFWDAWNKLEKKYVGRKDLNKQEMVYGAIRGMVSSVGDPYTTFFKPEAAKIFKEDVNGSFSGIGAEIGFRKGVLTIISPLENSPAEKAGLKAGDAVLKVDDKSTADMSLEEAVANIRGERGKEVTLTIIRDNLDETKEIKIIRDKIEIPTIKTEMKNGNIGYIKLYNFTGNIVQLFDDSVNKLIQQGAKRFVIDLRNNPGGFLGAAIDTASMVVPKGDIVLVEDFGDGNGKESKKYRSIGYKTIENTPLVVLINGGSASASEIFAGAVKGIDRVKIVGEKSFGKGSVQEVLDLPNETFLKVTIAKWLTPDGTSIQDEGITPDIEVKQKESEDNKKDTQLEKALEIVKTL
jgi:carboxyl-terminal processing protease